MEIPTESEFMERIIETLNLDTDVEITPETLLFGGELGLNSVDALEIGAEIGQRYRVELKPKDEATHKAFACIRTLHVLVVSEMQRMNEMSEAKELSQADAA